MKKQLLSCILIVSIFFMMAIPAHGAGIAVRASNVEANGGSRVEVPITLSGNTGITGICLIVNYHADLKLISYQRGEGLSSLEFTPGGDISADPIRFLWDGMDDDTTDGTIVTLVFEVPNKTAEYGVQLSCDQGDIFSADGSEPNVDFGDGVISVTAVGGAEEHPSGDGGSLSGEKTPEPTEAPHLIYATDAPSETPAETAFSFEDVGEEYAWAKTAISKMAERGVINGMSAVRFAPGEALTRAQIAKLLVNLYQLDVVDSGAAVTSYSDVAEGDWYAKPIAVMSGLGLVKGYEDGTFLPNKPVSREEMATMIGRTIEFLYGKEDVKYTLSFSDASDISAYAEDYVARLTAGEVLSGYEDGSFRPKNTATRAEAAVLLYRLQMRVEDALHRMDDSGTFSLIAQ